MSNLVAFLTLSIGLVVITSPLNGQLITRQQEMMLDKQQNELIIQQKKLQKELNDELQKRNQAQMQTLQPINQAIFDRIFNIPIQALRAVNELVKAVATIRATLSSANRDIVDG